MIRPHKRLRIWDKIIELIEETYNTTAGFPKDEIYGIVSQMRRAVISVAANIAEGCARRSKKEMVQFLTVSRGSLSEIDAYLDICLRLKFIKPDEYNSLSGKAEEVSRMLQGLINSNRVFS